MRLGRPRPDLSGTSAGDGSTDPEAPRRDRLIDHVPVERLAALPAWFRRVGRSRRAWLITIAGIVLVVVLIGGVLGVALLYRLNRLDVDPTGSRTGGTTYLVVGSDSREGLNSPVQRKAFGAVTTVQGDADTLLVLRVPDGGGRPVVASISRDLLVLNPPGQPAGLERLGLSWLRGPQATAQTLCRSLGLGIDHVISFDLQGFGAVVDAVGGINLKLDGSLRDTVTGFFTVYPGIYHFDGGSALQYVRSRHLERYDATTRQWVPIQSVRDDKARQVFRAVGSKIHLSPLNPIGAAKLAWTITGAISVDRSAGTLGLWGVAKAMRQVNGATNVDLPVALTDAPIPFGQLQPGARQALATLGAGGANCSHPALPQARQP